MNVIIPEVSVLAKPGDKPAVPARRNTFYRRFFFFCQVAKNE